MKIVVKGRCNASLPKDSPDYCSGDCCHYCGEDGYGKYGKLLLRLMGYKSFFEFARDHSYDAFFRVENLAVRFWDDSFRNPKRFLGGCQFQNPDGQCSLHIKDEGEENTSSPDYFYTTERKYHKPPACRRFPSGLEEFIKHLLPEVGNIIYLNKIWKKCGFVIEVVED